MVPCRRLSWLTAAIAITLSVPAYAQDDKDLTIATGGVTGIYFALGSAICRLIADEPEFEGIDCEAVPSQGSVANIGNLRHEVTDFAIIQSDIQANAYNGAEPFERRAFEELRHVATVHPEALTILQRPGNDIIDDTRDGPPIPTVFLGAGGSGTRALLRLAERHGFEPGSFDVARDLSTPFSVDALCRGQIEGLFYLVGHPNDLTNQATRQCNAEFVEAKGDISSSVLANESGFVQTVIPGGLYPTAEGDVATIGVRATLVTEADTPADTVYNLLKTLNKDLDELKRLHLAFKDAHPGILEMACDTAPIHEGARRFFEENGVEPEPCQ